MKKFAALAMGVFIFSPLAIEAAQITSITLSVAESADKPLYIHIPSIDLYTTIEGVGIDEKGRMDVPSGKTNKVGWYKYGVVPGNTGTAVLDAHNTAAFKKLKEVPVGEEIYVIMKSGKKLKFSVTKAKTYEVKKTDPSILFASTKSKQLNLITCAGKLLGNGEATHRLIVSAQLAVK
jgi:sortase A